MCVQAASALYTTMKYTTAFLRMQHFLPFFATDGAEFSLQSHPAFDSGGPMV